MIKKQVKVAPSLLSANFLDLRKEIELINISEADYLHIDVMDGHFVPNISIGFPLIEQAATISKKPLDVHLMVEKPEQYFHRLFKIGIEMISVHVEQNIHHHSLIQQLQKNNVKAGLVLNPFTPLELVYDNLLTVNPGFGGQEFIESMLNKIKKAKNMVDDYLKSTRKIKIIDIGVDGGININTIDKARQAGANSFIMGTSFFKSSNPKDFVNSLKKIALKELQI